MSKIRSRYGTDAYATLYRRNTSSAPSIPSDATLNLQSRVNGTNTLTAGSLTRWVDARGAGFKSIYQGTVGARATVSTLGGLLVPVFDGVDDTYTLAPTDVSTATATIATLVTASVGEIFAVVHNTALPSAADGTAWYSVNHDVIMGDSGSYAGLAFSGFGLAGGYFDAANRQPAVDAKSALTLANTWHVCRWTHNVKDITTQLDNGTPQTLTSPGTGSMGLTTGVARFGWSTGTLFWTGGIASIVCFNRVLTTQERADVYAVLASQYGVTTP